LHHLIKKKMRFHRSLLFGLLAAAPGYTQNGSVASPAMGFAFDANASAIRPLRGVPGASLLGDPIDSGFAISLAAVSPRQDFALAVSSSDSRLRLIALTVTNAGSLPDAALTAPDRIVFSPSGSAALLWQNGRLQAVSGLPDHAAVRDIDLSALTPAPSAMAVSDDGALIALSGDTSAWIMNDSGTSFQLALPGSTSALSFGLNNHDLIAASATGDIHVVRHPGADSDYRLIHAADEHTTGAIASRFSADGSRVFIVTADGNASTIAIDSGAVAAISCGCRATALDPLNSRDLFRLTAAGQSVLMLFDGSGDAGPKVWFVPPDRGVRESEGSVQ
jgi:hypothetical protein